jgi:hypothetical protein
MALPRGERQIKKFNDLAENLGNSHGIEFQGVSASLPKQKFEPLGHSIYVDRLRLGRYERIGNRKYAAYDANDRLLARFTKLGNARRAFDRLAHGGDQ